MKVYYENNRFSKHEQQVISKLHKNGYMSLSRGWPDIIAIGDKGEVVFIEVKGGKDKLRPEQYVVLTLLSDLGLDVRINKNKEDSFFLGTELTEETKKYGRELLWRWLRRYGLQNKLPAEKPDWITDKINKAVKEKIGYLKSKDHLTYTVPEASKIIGVSVPTMHKAIKAGKLPFLKLGERKLIIPQSALKKYLETCTMG